MEWFLEDGCPPKMIFGKNKLDTSIVRKSFIFMQFIEERSRVVGEQIDLIINFSKKRLTYTKISVNWSIGLRGDNVRSPLL